MADGRFGLIPHMERTRRGILPSGLNFFTYISDGPNALGECHSASTLGAVLVSDLRLGW